MAFRRILQNRGAGAGFTLVEVLVAMAVLLVIMSVIFTITLEVSNAWKSTTGKVEGFRGARAAFDAVTRTISQATLNTYYDYVDANGNFRGSGMSSGTISQTFTPYGYARQSELQFVCGQASTLLTGLSGTITPVTHAVFFQAPLGMTSTSSYTGLDQILNASGFYIIYGPDPTIPSYLGSTYATPHYRYRLMQFTQPSESFSVYQTSPTVSPTSWFTSSIVPTPSTASNFVLTENVIALVVWPKLSAGDQTTSTQTLTTNYAYDSRNSGTFSTANSTSGTTKEWNVTYNQLPPVVDVTMVAIDEASALKMGNTITPPNAKVGLTSTLFTSATYPTSGQNQLEQDLASMQSTLNANHVNYRVFQTEIAIRSSKWTTQ